MLVYFNVVDEFLTELERDRDEVGRGIVRVTHQFRRLHHGTATALSIIATFERAGDVVMLEALAGVLWDVPTQDEPVKAHAEATREAIDAACERLGLEVRGGVLKDAGNTTTPPSAAERR